MCHKRKLFFLYMWIDSLKPISKKVNFSSEKNKMVLESKDS